MAGNETETIVADVRAGDESTFGELVEPYRRELQVHCYRMLGSLEDSEDLVQETFLRAWRKRRTFEGRASLRAWLYRIATNACLDALERRPRVAAAQAGGRPLAEVPWLQPYPDRLLDELASSADEPEAELVAKETIELAFIAAIQLLPPRQRAVLISRDVLGWSAAETATLLGTSVASVNSPLQRARARMKEHLPRRRLDWARSDPSAEERALLRRYIEAADAGDPAAMIAVLREDAFCAMPPSPQWWLGPENIVEAWVKGGLLRAVSIQVGESRIYNESEWRDALVVVTCGEIELESVRGDSCRFGRGSVHCLVGLPLRVLRSQGTEPAVLVALSRR